jgi:hypothetical protein
MKKIYSILATILLMANVWAQSPQKLSYQAVIRNASNALVTNQAVGMKISILRGSAAGTEVYTETQTPTTNANGLVSIEIGNGTGFDTISWGIDTYFIKTETDPSGGTTYNITGTSQLLSVPYALYASNCGSVYSKNGKYGFGTTNPVAKFDFLGGNNWDVVNGEGDFRIGNAQYRIRMGVALGGGGAGASTIMQYGQTGGYNVLALGAQGNKLLFLNGGSQKVGIGTDNPAAKLEVVGNVKITDGTQAVGKVLTSDANGLASWQIPAAATHSIGESYGGGIVFYVYDGGQHGLIAATADVSAGMRWYAGTAANTLAKADGIGAGLKNTAIIIANQGYGDGATYSARLCNEYSVNVGGVTYGDWYLPSKYELSLLYLQNAVVGGFASGYYPSSTEESAANVWGQHFGTGLQTNYAKSYTDNIRPIRAF